MGARAKLERLGRSAQFNLCGHCAAGPTRVRRDAEHWIYPSVLPDGRRVRLLKVLLTNACCAGSPPTRASGATGARSRPPRIPGGGARDGNVQSGYPA